MLLVALLALLARWPMIPYAEVHWNGDGAITCLMAKHHWAGKLPLFFYGQAYNGSIESLFAAPFQAIYGPTLEGTAVSKVILMALMTVVLYRLCFLIGGRLGALAGSLPYAFGTMPLLVNLARQHSYIMVSMIGIAILIFGLRTLQQLTRRRVFGMGLLIGIGWFNNPQIISFVAPLLACFYLTGRTCHLINERKLGQAIQSTLVRHLVLGWFLLLAAWILITLGVAMVGGLKTELFGFTLSMERPYKYLQRAIGILGLSAILLEFALHSDKKRWVLLGALFVGGFLIGDSPHFYFHARNKLLGIELKRSTPSGIDPTWALTHLKKDLAPKGDDTLFNGKFHPLAQVAIPWLEPIFTGLRWAVMGIVLLGLLGVLIDQRHNLWQMLRLRPPKPTLGLLLLLQAIVLLLVFLSYPRQDMYLRYLQPWWPAYCALFASIAIFLRKWIGKGALIAVGIWVAFFVTCAVQNHAHLKEWSQREPDWLGLRKLISVLEQKDRIRYGYANYWFGYRMIFLSDERVILRPWPEDQPELYRPYIRQIDAAKELVWVFRLTDKSDPVRLREFNEKYKDRMFKVVREQRLDDWLILHCQRLQ